MTINERIKHFRKDILHINQTEFAEKLGLRQTGISYIEKNGSTITDKTIKCINLAYNVSEEWLKTGTGDMYEPDDSFNYNEFIKNKSVSPLELEILKTYFELDEDIRKQALEHFKSRLLAFQSLQTDTVPDTTTVEEAEASYIKSRSNSAHKTDLSASSITVEEKGMVSNE